MNCQTPILCFETLPKVFMWDNKPIFIAWLILFLEEGSSPTNIVNQILPLAKKIIQNYYALQTSLVIAIYFLKVVF